MSEPLRWRVGDVRVTRVVEMVTTGISSYVLPKATPEAMAEIPWIGPFVDGRGVPVLSIHALVVESEGCTLVVDTCVGNDKERRFRDWDRLQGSFLEDFVAAGFSTSAVDAVLCTHLHPDHVGWNTRLVDGRWQPTFERARYLFGRREWRYWQEAEGEDDPVLADSVVPVFDRNQADLVDDDHAITSEVSLEPTPGHTPGHVAVRIRSRGEEAVITGDLIHHPCQMVHPGWSPPVDVDPDLAASTRRGFLDACADAPVLVIGTHFAGPTAGRVVRDGSVYRLESAVS